MDYIPPQEMHYSISNAHITQTFTREIDVAQYKGSDYSNALRVERGVTLEKAFAIAEADPEIDYFVYVKGIQMVLECPPDFEYDEKLDPLHLITFQQYVFDSGEWGVGYCRIFRQGDVVFFKKEGKQLGTAPGLADVYSKYEKNSSSL